MILTIITWFLSPLGRIVGMTLAAALMLGAVYFKIQSDAVSRERARVEQENSNAVNKAREARDAARDAFDRNPARGVPESDYRD